MPEKKKVAKKAAPKKKVAVKKIAKKAAVKKVAKKATQGKTVSNEAEIAKVAYLIFKNRVEKSLPGDAESDWLAAVEKVAS